MSKICIFCRELKNDFNEEHVIPASLGGAYIIHTVCKECNTKLGKKIDNHLANHKAVLFYRNQFKTARGSYRRNNIANPLKGTFKDTDDNDIRFEFNEEGKPVHYLIPQYKVKTLEDGFTEEISIFMSEKDMNEEKIKEYVAKKYNLDITSLVIKRMERILQAPPAELKIQIENNNSFILGTMKIGYEFLISMIPAYINDPLSKEFVNILLSADIDTYHKKFYPKDEIIRQQLIDKIESIEGLQLHHHILLLTTIPGNGLCCAVRIYNWIYAVCFSNSDDYLNSDIFLVNDILQRRLQIIVSVKLTSCVIGVNLISFNDREKEIIREQAKLDFEGCRTQDGQLPLFNSEGKLFTTNLNGLRNAPSINAECFVQDKLFVISVTCLTNNYFIKLFKEEKLIPLQQVYFLHDFIT